MVYRFNRQEKHGITVTDEDLHESFDFHFAGCDAKVDRIDYTYAHTIDPKERFEICFFVPKERNRAANHIVAYLDRITTYERTAKDDVTIINQLGSFNLAQLMNLIQFASENNAVNVSALLLDYKDKHYPDADPFAEFVLDL